MSVTVPGAMEHPLSELRCSPHWPPTSKILRLHCKPTAPREKRRDFHVGQEATVGYETPGSHYGQKKTPKTQDFKKARAALIVLKH